MPISFTGFKNASTLKIVNPSTPNDNYMYSFTTQLTDDTNGNDLSNFRSLRSKQQTMSIPDLADDRFVNISLIKSEGTDKYLTINGEPLEPRKDTLGLYSFIGKLTQKVKEASEASFIINSDYVKSEEFDEMAVPGYNIREALGKNYDSIAENFVEPNIVKSQTEDIFQGVQDIMMDYLA